MYLEKGGVFYQAFHMYMYILLWCGTRTSSSFLSLVAMWDLKRHQWTLCTLLQYNPFVCFTLGVTLGVVSWIFNTTHWASGKYWFFKLWSSFKCWHISWHNIKKSHSLIPSPILLEKSLKYWEASSTKVCWVPKSKQW